MSNRKVFLSAVGTGNYLNCNYYYNNTKVNDVQFIQTAVYKIFCSDFSDNDKVIFAFTKQASERHEESIFKELYSKCGVGGESLRIPDGKSEDELWEIFRLFNECIDYNDEIILDITHSFRSLPIVFIMLLQYLKTTKDITISGLYYGAFEKLGNFTEAQSMKLEDRNAPVFDLTPFVSLHDWSQAIANFRKFGKVDLLQQLSKKQIKPILRDSKGENQVAQSINLIIKQLKMFSDAVLTCRGSEIYVMNLKQDIFDKIDDLQKEMIPPLTPVLDQLKVDFKPSYNEDVMNGLFAVKWCVDHELIQQGYTLLLETIISILEQEIQIPQETSKAPNKQIEKRNFISSFLSCYDISENEWRNELNEYKEYARKYRCERYEALAKIYKSLSEKRNDMNHAGLKSSSSKFDKLKSKLNEFYQQTCDVIAQYEK